jgi:hypothetical protein
MTSSSPQLAVTQTGWAHPTIWWLNSHLVVKRPNDIPKTLTKWGSFSFAPTLQKNDELAHLLDYFELFPDIIASYKRQLNQLPPWH